MRSIWYLILMILLIVIGMASGSSNSTDYSRAEQFVPDNIIPNLYNMSVAPNWIGTHRFWYLNSGREGDEYFIVDTKNATKKPLFNRTAFSIALSKVSGTKIDPSKLPFTDITIMNGLMMFTALNKTWQFDPKNYEITETSVGLNASPGETLSPDGKYAAFVSDHNLWIRETATGKKYSLTSNGSGDYAYAERSGTVLQPISEVRLNKTSEPYAVWSPDSRRIATFRMDQRNVTPLCLLQYAPGNDSRPMPWSYRFAMPGEKNVPMYEPVVIDVLKKRVIRVTHEAQPEVSLMDTDEDVLQWWSDDGQVLYLLYAERGEKSLSLLKANPENGLTEKILEERGSTYVEANLDYASLPNAVVLKTGDIVWFSEKSGYGHLYLYGKDGTQKNAITAGNWAVRRLLHVDENSSVVYFTAGGMDPNCDPYYRFLYKVNLNGTGLKLLTPEDADHDIEITADNMAFLDTYSRVDLLPITVLRDLNGSITLVLEKGDIKNLTDIGWKPPERFIVKALDGETDLYGLLIKPTNFNASQEYPVVETVYPGPWIIVTAKSFPGDMSWVSKLFWRGQALSELGFIVVTMDGPGTPYRSKDFHDSSYGHLGAAGSLSDHINSLKQLAKNRSYMDLDRVGIFGHSAGGFMTAQALLTYPDFYKVGVASSGNYDSRFYGSYWGEKYEGLQSDYKEQITSLKAGNLTGKLLLITGDVDDNVNPCMTIQLADAFISADKPFDLLMMTNRNHDLSYDPYYLHRLFDYFVENL